MKKFVSILFLLVTSIVCFAQEEKPNDSPDFVTQKIRIL